MKVWQKNVVDIRATWLGVRPMVADDDAIFVHLCVNFISDDAAESTKGDKFSPVFLTASDNVQRSIARARQFASVISMDCDDATWGSGLARIGQFLVVDNHCCVRHVYDAVPGPVVPVPGAPPPLIAHGVAAPGAGNVMADFAAMLATLMENAQRFVANNRAPDAAAAPDAPGTVLPTADILPAAHPAPMVTDHSAPLPMPPPNNAGVRSADGRYRSRGLPTAT